MTITTRWLSDLVVRVSAHGAFGGPAANHVLVNEYQPGRGIMAHEDGPMFYPTVCTVTLGSHALLNLYRRVHGGDPHPQNLNQRFLGSLLLEPRSLLVLQERAYTSCLHDISAGALLDVVNHSRVLNWRLTELGRQDTLLWQRFTGLQGGRNKETESSTEELASCDADDGGNQTATETTPGKDLIRPNNENAGDSFLKDGLNGVEKGETCGFLAGKGSEMQDGERKQEVSMVDNTKCRIHVIPKLMYGENKFQVELSEFVKFLTSKLENSQEYANNCENCGNLQPSKYDAFKNEFTLSYTNVHKQQTTLHSEQENNPQHSSEENTKTSKFEIKSKSQEDSSILLTGSEKIDAHPTTSGAALTLSELDEGAGLAGCGTEGIAVLVAAVGSNRNSFILRRGTRVSLTIRRVPKVIKTKLFLGRNAYDLTCHTSATGVKLTVEQPLPKPKQVDVVVPVLDKKCITKTFHKKQARELMSLIESFNEEQMAIFKEQLEVNGMFKIPFTDWVVDSTHVTSFVTETRTAPAEHVTPCVIEPSFGMERILYAILEHTFRVREDGKRTFFSLHPRIAPLKVAVIALSLRHKQEAAPVVQKIVSDLVALEVPHTVDDSTGSIGRRYARTDEASVPFVVTVDFDTLQDCPPSVTLRERDSTQQVRLPVVEVAEVVEQLSRGRLRWKDVTVKYPPFLHQQTAPTPVAVR
ncbi:Anticodon-binding [Trinorchestia longiramus]|nr:Anticodon-binding [Trinorchestia longiramus]